MILDGKALAASQLEELVLQTAALVQKGTTPCLTVILIGNNPASLSYIRQKQKAAGIIGATLRLMHRETCTPEDLRRLIEAANTDPSVHGVIVQRPVPAELTGATDILSGISPRKDVDGFVPGSSFDPPVALAVIKILEAVHRLKLEKRQFAEWLRDQNITIIGRGETAGKPINDHLRKYQCATSVIHSQTPDAPHIISQSDVVISCVGKRDVVRKEEIKPGCILISVGIWKDDAGKLHGDYSEEDIAQTAGFYTPTPGGVGPVNVACLMANLVASASHA